MSGRDAYDKGRGIRWLRVKLGLSIRECANRVNMGLVEFSELERGVRPLPWPEPIALDIDDREADYSWTDTSWPEEDEAGIELGDACGTFRCEPDESEDP